MFDAGGKVIPVTLVSVEPNTVTQVKTKAVDGYDAIQIGIGAMREKKVKKTQKGKPFRYLKECRLETTEGVPAAGGTLDVSLFAEGETVKVSGVSKGKGFQGAVKRHGFKGRLSATHGTKHELRTIGSMGTSFPERVIKGKRMPGRMGAERVTVRNLKIVKVDKDRNIIAIKGAVPGVRGTLLEIRS